VISGYLLGLTRLFSFSCMPRPVLVSPVIVQISRSVYTLNVVNFRHLTLQYAVHTEVAEPKSGAILSALPGCFCFLLRPHHHAVERAPKGQKADGNDILNPLWSY
jgi:hypothetical protein